MDTLLLLLCVKVTLIKIETNYQKCLINFSHESSQGSGRPQSAITLKSTVASEIKDPKADKAKDYDDPHDRRPLGICITGLPARSSGRY